MTKEEMFKEMEKMAPVLGRKSCTAWQSMNMNHF